MTAASHSQPPRHPHRRSRLWQRASILFIVGAIGGSLGDLFHVLSGTDGYPPGAIRVPVVGLPLWVPALFGSAGVAIGLSHPWADIKMGRKSGRPQQTHPTRVGAALLMMLGIWAASGFLPLTTGSSMDLFIGTCAVALWWLFDRTREGLQLAFLTAALGTLVELVQVRWIGNFYYIPPATNLGGVPSWLPLLYVAASVALGNFGRMLTKRPLAKAPAWDR